MAHAKRGSTSARPEFAALDARFGYHDDHRMPKRKTAAGARLRKEGSSAGSGSQTNAP